MVPWEFIVREGPEPGRRIPLPSERVTIGSGAACDLRFPANTMRERHTEVRRVEGVFEAVDLTGANLMWVDGKATARAELFSGSVLRVGRVELLFVSLEETASRVPDGTERSLPRLSFEKGPNADPPRGAVPLAALNRATPAFSSVAPPSARKAAPPPQNDLPSSSSGRFATGDVIDGRYRILQRIAAGGMGEVYRAEHVELGKPLALKVMLPTLNADQEFVNRFKIEAVAASRIGHPNIIDISDFGRTADGRFYFAMEFLDGMTLSSLVHRHGRQSPSRAVGLILQAARALAAAHELRIIHRDLKPDNIMVLQRPGNPDLVKVLDFGVARVEVGQESIGKTAAGIVVGTPQYMSPEQAKAVVVDVRSDIYSLGLILYELLAGKPAFTGETPPIVMVKQVTEPPPPLPEDVPEDLQDLVMHMLAKEPGARPQQMSEVVQRLDDLRRSMRTGDFVAQGPTGAAERVATPAQPVSGRPAAITKTPARAPTPARTGTPRPASQKPGLQPPAPAPTITIESPLKDTVPIPPPPKPALADEEPLPELKPSRAPLLAGVLLAVGAVAGAAVLLTRSEPEAKDPVEVVPVPAQAPPEAATADVHDVEVRVESVPAGAAVSAGARALGLTPLTLRRPTDTTLDLTFTLEGYGSQTRRLRFAPGAELVSVTLEKPAPEVKPAPPPPVEPESKPRSKPKPKKDDLKDVPF